MKKLDLGCGATKKKGFIGVDILKLSSVDICHNLTQYPYPFEDNSIDEIWMDNVLEHLPSPMRVMEEVYRITKNGAKITIAVPYFRSHYAFIDPTHVNFFGVNWFNYFDPRHTFQKKMQYSNILLHIDKIKFDREWLDSKCGFFHKLLIKYANKYPVWYESNLSHIFPLNSLTYYLTVVK
jgi:predicted SAM-dependent methyltransferase